MTQLSDLVRDAELQTRFHPEYTTHVYIETGPSAQQRAVLREEQWKRQRKPVGNGSYGNVWLERCESGQRDVVVRAVKEVDKIPHASKQIDYHRELEAIMRFSHQKFERCFVKPYGWYENDESMFIAMEYFEHRDLQRHLSLSPPLPESEAQQIVFQVLEGLSFMHENNFSHRDLKPGNILVKSMPPDPWWVKLSDFGISKRVVDSSAASTTMKGGTMRYMAPELFGFVRSDTESSSSRAQAADMWALGEIAFQMLTKRPTFEDLRLLSNFVQTPNIFPDKVLHDHNVSDAGISFITKIMQPKPEDRQIAAKALHDPWMEPHNSYITGKVSTTVTETIMSRIMPPPRADESVVDPSGRWSTVSLAAPASMSTDSRASTTSRQQSTMDTTISFPDANATTRRPRNRGKTDAIATSTEARFFILKSYNKTNIETSAAHGIWCCNKATNTRLSNAYRSTSGPVFLIFSVNESRKFCGVAQMKSPWSPDVTTAHWEDGTWEGGFLVEWLSWKEIKFDDVRHLTHKEENGVSVTRGMFVLELYGNTGPEMMRRFGVAHLVPQPSEQQPSNMSTVGSLAVGGLDLATNQATNEGIASVDAATPTVRQPSTEEAGANANVNNRADEGHNDVPMMDDMLYIPNAPAQRKRREYTTLDSASEHDSEEGLFYPEIPETPEASDFPDFEVIKNPDPPSSKRPLGMDMDIDEEGDQRRMRLSGTRSHSSPYAQR